MAYYRAREAAQIDELVFRAYVTDAIKAIATNTMRHAVPGVGMVEDGVSMRNRWIELQHPEPAKEKPEDTRSCEEITADMWTRIKGGE